jgi:hypothetical protein
MNSVNNICRQEYNVGNIRTFSLLQFSPVTMKQYVHYKCLAFIHSSYCLRPVSLLHPPSVVP